MSRGILVNLGRYAAGVVAVFFITAFYHHYFFFKTTTIVLTFLLAILGASTMGDLGVPIVMSVTATLAFDYFFLVPYGTFNVNDPQDWVALVSFLLTAVIGSNLSVRARREAAQANRQRNEVQQLYDFSRALLNALSLTELVQDIPRRIVDSFHATAAALYLPDAPNVYKSGNDHMELSADRLKNIFTQDCFQVDSQAKTYLGPVRSSKKTLGSVGILGQEMSRQTVEAVGTLVASTIERARAIEQLGKAESARERERFKSVLLDAITHDFRTPLTSIKGSVSSLLAGVELTEPQQHEFLVIIDEECDRINRLVGEAAEMSRLEAGEVKMTLESCRAADLISAALADSQSIRSARPVRVDVVGDLRVRADQFWAKKAFVNLIKNADLYSSSARPVSIRAEAQGDFVLFHVEDEGPGIDPAELEEIFGRFYRGKQNRLAHPGTGLGLPIARAIVEAQGGTVGVVSQVG